MTKDIIIKGANEYMNLLLESIGANEYMKQLLILFHRAMLLAQLNSTCLRV
jgi:hypothetical protein